MGGRRWSGGPGGRSRLPGAIESVWVGAHWRTGDWLPLLPLANLAVALLAAVGVWVGRPRLELRADGVRVVRLSGTLTVPWSALAAVERNAGLRWCLRPDRPEHVRRTGLAVEPRPSGVPLPRLLGRDEAYQAAVVEYYRSRPDERPRIGTVDGWAEVMSYVDLHRST